MHQNTSWNGFYTHILSENMPNYFSNLFRARQPLEFHPAADGQVPKNYRLKGYQALIDDNTNAVDRFEDKNPDVPATESKAVQKAREKKEKVIAHLTEQRKQIKQYNPDADKLIKGDPLKTIFVGRLNYSTDEDKLQDAFGIYGTIKRLRIVRNEAGKSKGYAFIEYQEQRQAEIAYKRGDRKKIDNYSVLVDKEQARTDRYWLPRRLGGGKGEKRRAPREHQTYLKDIKRELRREWDKDKKEPATTKKQKVEEQTAVSAGFVAKTLHKNLNEKAIKKDSVMENAEDREEGEL